MTVILELKSDVEVATDEQAEAEGLRLARYADVGNQRNVLFNNRIAEYNVPSASIFDFCRPLENRTPCERHALSPFCLNEETESYNYRWR